ncbi:MAG: hypothetical protein P4L84_22675 [Isosphaeraceae bacterium]|nr:hypothetical protein [Isosphaeraceae bacterium]
MPEQEMGWSQRHRRMISFRVRWPRRGDDLLFQIAKRAAFRVPGRPNDEAGTPRQ